MSNKWFAPVGLLVLAVGGCAPAQSTTRPAPAPRPVPVAAAPAPAPAPPAVEPVQALASAPRDWWLLDEEADRIRGISAVRSYQELLAGQQPKRSVVVAIIDSGIDLEHEDLDDNLWVNQDEVAGNRRDDDRNGYVDDRHGWNFIGGPGGEHVNQDTYEMTRVYAALRPRYEGARADTLSAAARAEFQLYQEVRDKLQKRRAESEEQLQQYRMIETALERVTSVLQTHLGTDSLTVERVSAIRSTDPMVQRAREVYLQMAQHQITAEALREAREHLESGLKFGLNPDFNPRPIVGDNYADVNERFYGNPDVEGPDPDHGTHVAGIIGAERGNGIGIDGIAPAVKLMALRAVPDGDERDKDIANAIRYAVDNGAHIINMSFGKGYSPQKSVVDEAVRYAASRGVLIVHAAGNDAADLGTAPNFPTRAYAAGGTAPNWIEVGASSWRGAGQLAAPFTNFNREQVDVFAPGVDILSTVPGDEYRANSGTSMAAPVVSGLAALLMAYYPQLTAEQVRQIILETATRYPEEMVTRPGSEDQRIRFGDLSATGGVVNAYRAIQAAQRLAGGN